MSDTFIEWMEWARTGNEALRGVSRAALVDAAREYKQTAWKTAQARHESRAPGALVRKLLVESADTLVGGVIYFAAFHAQDINVVKHFSLCALGGYGRGELAPASDLDIGLFHGGRLTDALRRLVDFLVPFLWDIGIAPGHAILSVPEATDLAKQDPVAWTAYMQARVLLGNPRPADVLRKQLARLGAASQGRLFDLLRRRESPDDLPEAYRELFALEPDIKESVGGLRDYHVARWLLQLKRSGMSEEDMTALGLMAPEDHLALVESLDFIWRIRNELHFHTGRCEDQLSYAEQRHVARAFGYGNGDRESMARFMQDYYHAAQQLRRFLLLTVRCCGPAAKTAAPQAETAAAHSRAPYHVHEGRLWLGTPDQQWFTQNPARLMEVFWVCARRDVRLSDDALPWIRRHLALAGPDFQANAVVGHYFQAICAHPLEAGAVLRQMADCGLLAAYLPEFQAICGIVRYADFHSYPVDEHTLRALEAIAAIPALTGTAAPLLKHCLEHIRNPHILILAILMHDWGKAAGEIHAAESVRLAQVACERMGFPEEDTQLVMFLVEHHMTMSNIAFYRDTDDMDVIKSFAELMKTDTRMRKLFLLSYADLIAVAPGVWNDWKGALLLKLYLKAERVMLGRADGAEEEFWLLPKAQETARIAPKRLQAGVEQYLRGLGEGYFIAFSPETIIRHMECADTAMRHGIALRGISHQETGMSEVVVCARDRAGLFSMIAGTFTAHAADVQGAAIFTRPDGWVVDCFTVKNAVNDRPLTNAQFEHIEKTLRAVLLGDTPIGPLVEQSRRKLFALLHPVAPIPTRIGFDNGASATDTVIDIDTGDRTGLLYDMAHALSESGVDIRAARIMTDVRHVRDSFYVRVRGGKIPKGPEQEALAATLERAIRQAGDSEPAA